MGQRLILRGTLPQVQFTATVIDHIAAIHHFTNGETIINTVTKQIIKDVSEIKFGDPLAVVSKIVATGEHDFNFLTLTWDTPIPENYAVDEETGEIIPAEGTLYYIESPTNNPKFKDWRLFIPEGVEIPCEEVAYSVEG